MRAHVLALTTVAAALLSVSPGSARAETPRDVPRVSAVVGVVEVLAAGEAAWAPAAVGRPLGPGDALRTGPASKAEVTHAAGVIRLFERTLLRLPADAIGDASPALRRVELLAGQSLYSVARDRFGALVAAVSLSAGSLFEVVTPRIVAGVKGTEFAVLEGETRSVVAVYSGLVEASDAATGTQTAMLGPGQAASYGDGGLDGVSAFTGRHGFDSWSDARAQTAAAGLAAGRSDTGPDAADTAAARPDAPAGRGGGSPTGGGKEGGSAPEGSRGGSGGQGGGGKGSGNGKGGGNDRK